MKKSYLTTTGLISVSILLSVACSKKESNKASQNKGFVQYNLESFDVSEPSKLSKNQKEILKKVKANQPVSFEFLTDEMMAVHFRESQENGKSKSVKESTNLLAFKGLAQSVKLSQKLTSSNVGLFKTQYEKAVESIHKAELIYNMEATNINDIYNEGKMQCYSGTYLNQVTLRNYVNHVDDFNALNPVVLYESGHVLPGFMKKTEKNEWELVGVETTVAGQGIKNYGLVKDLDRPLRIVDAHDFALTEIFKGTIKDSLVSKTGSTGSKVEVGCLSGLNAVIANRAAKKYNIPVARLEQNIKGQSGGQCDLYTLAGGDKKALNQSMMSFGQADVQPGDLNRPKMDVLDDRLTSGSGAQIISQLRGYPDVVDFSPEDVFGVGRCVKKAKEGVSEPADTRACGSNATIYLANEKVSNFMVLVFPPIKLSPNDLASIYFQLPYFKSPEFNWSEFKVLDSLDFACRQAYSFSEGYSIRAGNYVGNYYESNKRDTFKINLNTQRNSENFILNLPPNFYYDSFGAKKDQKLIVPGLSYGDIYIYEETEIGSMFTSYSQIDSIEKDNFPKSIFDKIESSGMHVLCFGVPIDELD